MLATIHPFKNVLVQYLNKLDQRGLDTQYLKHILQNSFRAFWIFSKILPISRFRNTLPKDLFYLSKIEATRTVDCGTCVQTVVNLAKDDGVDIQLLENLIAGHYEHLTEMQKTVMAFTKKVVQGTYDEDKEREKILAQLGQQALIELSLSISSSMVFPITKRVLGFAKSCSKVEVKLIHH